jgi:OPA family hexose phosphate transport protein UhpT-like MFS transporter
MGDEARPGFRSRAKHRTRGVVQPRLVAASPPHTHAGRDHVAVVVILLVAYASLYLCRSNVDAAFPLLSREYGYTNLQLGSLSSVATVSYAVGKIVMGAAGDVVGGRRIMLVAMFGSVAASFAIGLSGALVSLTVFAAINRFFQAGGWGGLVHVISRWFPPGRHGAIMGTLSTSYEGGAVVTFLFCGWLKYIGFGWHALFVINPLILAAVALAVALLLRGTPPQPVPEAAPRLEADATEPKTTEPDASLGSVLVSLASKPAFWATAVMSMLLTFLRIGFLTWTPKFLSDLETTTFGQSADASAIVKTAIFPAAGAIAALSAGPLSDRFGPGRRAPVMAVSLSILIAAVLALAHMPAHSTSLRVVFIGVCGLFLLGPYSLLGGAISLDIAGKRGTAVTAGIVDGVGYFGASLSGVVLGGVADRAGWTAAFDVMAAVAFLSALVAMGWTFFGRRRAPAAG